MRIFSAGATEFSEISCRWQHVRLSTMFERPVAFGKKGNYPTISVADDMFGHSIS